MKNKVTKKPSLNTIKENNNVKQKGRFTLSKSNRSNGPKNGERIVTIERDIKMIKTINELRIENVRLKRNLCKIRALLTDVIC